MQYQIKTHFALGLYVQENDACPEMFERRNNAIDNSARICPVNGIVKQTVLPSNHVGACTVLTLD